MPISTRLGCCFASFGISLGEHMLPNPWHGVDTVAGCAFVAGALMGMAVFYPAKAAR